MLRLFPSSIDRFQAYSRWTYLIRPKAGKGLSIIVLVIFKNESSMIRSDREVVDIYIDSRLKTTQMASIEMEPVSPIVTCRQRQQCNGNVLFDVIFE